MFDRIDLNVRVYAPEVERDLQLQFHILENYRDNHLDLGIFRERMSTSGFGDLEYERMIKSMVEDHHLTKQERYDVGKFTELRLSMLGKAYLDHLRQRGVPQVVPPIAPQSYKVVPMVEAQTFARQLEIIRPSVRIKPAAPHSLWRNFWRRDVADAASVVLACAAVAGVCVTM